jgi:hypothetical protein
LIKNIYIECKIIDVVVKNSYILPVGGGFCAGLLHRRPCPANKKAMDSLEPIALYL